RRTGRGRAGVPRRPAPLAGERLVAVRPGPQPGGAGEGAGGRRGARAVSGRLAAGGRETDVVLLLPAGGAVTIHTPPACPAHLAPRRGVTSPAGGCTPPRGCWPPPGVGRPGRTRRRR